MSSDWPQFKKEVSMVSVRPKDWFPWLRAKLKDPLADFILDFKCSKSKSLLTESRILLGSLNLVVAIGLIVLDVFFGFVKVLISAIILSSC